MKVAVTSEKNTLDALFDCRILEAPYFLVVDMDTGNYEVIRNQFQSHQDDEIIPCLNELVSRQVDTVISGKCDIEIIRELFNNGIRVYHSKKASVKDIIKEFTEHHLLSCIQSNYLFNLPDDSFDTSYNAADITEIIAGAISYNDDFNEKLL